MTDFDLSDIPDHDMSSEWDVPTTTKTPRTALLEEAERWRREWDTAEEGR